MGIFVKVFYSFVNRMWLCYCICAHGNQTEKYEQLSCVLYYFKHNNYNTAVVKGASCHIVCNAVNIPQGRFTFESEFKHIS